MSRALGAPSAASALSWGLDGTGVQLSSPQCPGLGSAQPAGRGEISQSRDGRADGAVGERDWVLTDSLISHLLSTYYILGTVLGPTDTTVSKRLTV